MTLPEPYAPLLANLAIPIAGIPSPAAIAQGLDHLAVNPSGTGAFRLASPDDWTRDSQMVLQANPDYWGGAPKVEQFIVRVIPESSTRLQQVEAGEIDIAWALTPEDVERTRENPDLVVVEDAGLNTNMRRAQRRQGALHLEGSPAGAQLRGQQGRALRRALQRQHGAGGRRAAAGRLGLQPGPAVVPVRSRQGARAAGRRPATTRATR